MDHRSIVRGPESLERCGIHRQRPGNGHRDANLLGGSQPLERPPYPRENPFEAKVRHRDDFGEAVCQAPLDDACEHAQRRFVSQPIATLLDQAGIDAETGALHHRGMSVELTIGQQRWKDVCHHRRPKRREEPRSPGQPTTGRCCEYISRAKRIELVRLMALWTYVG